MSFGVSDRGGFMSLVGDSHPTAYRWKQLKPLIKKYYISKSVFLLQGTVEQIQTISLPKAIR